MRCFMMGYCLVVIFLVLLCNVADRLQSNGKGRAFPCKVQKIRAIIVQAKGLHYHNMLHRDGMGAAGSHGLVDAGAVAMPQHGEPFGRGGSVNELLIEGTVVPLGSSGTSTPRPDGMNFEEEAATESLHTLTLSRVAVLALLHAEVAATESLHTLTLSRVAVLALLRAVGAATESLHTLTLSRVAVLALLRAEGAATESLHTLTLSRVAVLALLHAEVAATESLPTLTLTRGSLPLSLVAVGVVSFLTGVVSWGRLSVSMVKWNSLMSG